MTLDLHGTKHENVKRKVDVFVWEHMKKKTSQVKIVTGNSAPMKDIVTKCLSDYSLSPREEILNTGTLIIDLI